MSRAEIGLACLVLYLFIGTVLWIAGVRTFGGFKAYREYLEERETVPMWFIFLTFIVAWPFFLRRN